MTGYTEEQRALTYADGLLPIPIREMVVNCVAPRAWTHLAGARGDRVDVGPTAFRGFTIRSADERCEVEGVRGLTELDMRGEVEFRYQEYDVDAPIEIKSELASVYRHPVPQVLGPLTNNIVRNDKPDKLSFVEAREE
jgi:hypothetical protein